MASDSASRGSSIIITSVIFTVFAALIVVARLIARFGLLKNGGRDEIAIVIALFTSIALLFTTLQQVKYGLGRHSDNVTDAEFESMQKWLFITIPVYAFSLTFTKVSIILQYLRVFVGLRITYACWVALVFIAACGIQGFFTAIFICKPISAFWDSTTTGTCISRKFLWFFAAALNILTDLIVITLPMPVLSTLGLPRKQKISLMFVFALGGFVCIVSILRLRALYIAAYTTKDLTWDNAEAAIWTIIEVSTGIICACLPTIKPLVSRFFPRLLSTNRIRRGTQLSNTYGTTPAGRMIPLSHNDSSWRTTTTVQAGHKAQQDMETGRSTDKNGNDIYVMTSMAQDVERKSEVGSEKDLIIQR
jgi:hypothetical protein